MWGCGAWTGLIWLRTGTVEGTCEYGNEHGGGGLHKMRGVSWLAENRLASQEGLCFME